MNIRKFFNTFIKFTLIFSVILFVIVFAKFYFSDFGENQKLDVLDEYKRGARRNVLVLGTDKSGLRSDVMMIFSFSSKEKTIHSMSVPRDTRVELYGRYQKINTALAIGEEELAIKTVKELTGIPIHDFVKVNFQAVSDVVDAVDGVEFDVPQNMNYKDPYQDLVIDLDKGLQVLDGEHALQLLRFRQYPMGDIQRVEVQQNFIKEAFRQKAKAKYILKAGKIYSAITDNITSSLTVSEVTKLARTAIGSEIETFEFPNHFSPSGIYLIVNEEEMEKLAQEKFM